jgi:hypothetical protein
MRRAAALAPVPVTGAMTTGACSRIDGRGIPIDLVRGRMIVRMRAIVRRRAR